MALLGKLFGAAGDGAGSELGAVGGYRLVRKLASGPMSTVYLAEDSAGKQVVVKVLSAHGNRIAEKLSVRLGKPWEGEKARGLNHPNVVHTLACGKEHGQYYIVMEYLSGGSLSEHLRVRTAEIMARRLEIMIGAANGLAYVHEKGIIHRDVCPKNLMFDTEGTVKLIDFGVAIHKFDHLKQTEIRTGRPSYLAPELIRYNQFNVQTDVYAFGVMLYETFTGQRPFAGETREELMNQHLRAEPVPPSRLDPSLSRDMDRIILRAMAKAPQQRHSSMRQIVTDLVRLRGLAT